MVGLRPGMRGGLRLPPLIEPPPAGPLRQMPFAPMLAVALGPADTARAGLQVREGQDVFRGQVLAAPAGAREAAVHAPATGRVVRIAEQGDGMGGTRTVLRLAPLSGDTQEIAPIGGPVSAGLAADALLDRLCASGLGNGRESVHARLLQSREQGCQALVINGIDPEPVFGRVAAVLAGQGADLVTGLACLQKMLGIERAILAVETPDTPAARRLAVDVPGLVVHSLAPRYPQGEPELLLPILARAQPGLAATPSLLLDLATVAEVGRLLSRGWPMTDQLVSLVGPGLARPGCYRVPLGTPLGFALDHAGLAIGPVRVLLGGPMRGQAVADLDLPIDQDMTGFAVLVEQASGLARALPCIRCGDCVSVCPVGLQPAELGLLARRGDVAAMHQDHHLERCIECGCCAYVCPSQIPLVQQFRAAKRQWQRIRPALPEAVAA
ncbi:MAG: 4Fe-4S dicluster domain-containing protein [Wenzhouxiangella sp.]